MNLRAGFALSLLMTCSILGSGAHAAAPALFPNAQPPLATLHVATNGNDTSGTGSAALPFRTLSRAAQAAVPGTEIRIHPGTHAGGTYLSDLHGTAEHPIWIRGADPTNRPVLFGGTESLHLTRPRYVLLQNLEASFASANGINCDDGGEYANDQAAGFLVFSNLFIHDIGGGGNQDGLKLSGIRDFVICDTVITRCGGAASGSGVDMVGCHRGVIQGSTFYDLSANAVQAKGGTTDIEIRQCIVSNAGHRGVNLGGSTGFEFFRPPLSTTAPNVEAANIRVLANLFHGCTAAVAYVGSVDCVVANNTIIEPTRWVFRILQETVSSGGYTFRPCASNAFQNNLVYYNSGTLSLFVNIGGSTDPASFAVPNNLWYAYNNPGAAPHPLPGSAPNNLFGLNPQFRNAALRDYHISVQSPAATNGLASAAVDADFDHVPYLTPPSRGAYEVSGDTDADSLPDYWELFHFTTLVHNAASDPDLDQFPNGDERAADTDPDDPASLLRIFALARGPEGWTVQWHGGRRSEQFLERLTPGGGPPEVLATHPAPTPVTNLWEGAASAPASFFRIRATATD